MIEVNHLAKKFRLPQRKKAAPARIGAPDPREQEGWFHAVRDVSFDCAPGEVLGLLGPNGAGKTTTLRLLSTALRPDSGSARMNGIDIVEQPLLARQQIGFLSGSTGLYGRLTVRENVEYFGRLHGVAPALLKQRCDALFEQLKMHDFADRRADQLSTGMRQKCSIARTVVHQPHVVILDEPTTGLDVMSAKILLDFIASYKALRIPLIFSTHHLHEVEKLCDRVCIINHGVTAFNGSTAELRQLGGSNDLYDAFVRVIDREHDAMWIIYLKEVRELLRDRKTVIFTILIPIFALPLLFVGFGLFASMLSSKAEQADLNFALFGQAHAPQLSQRFAQEKSMHEVHLPDPASINAAIADDRIQFALVISPGFEDTLAHQQQAVLTLHFNSASSGEIIRRRVKAVIDAHNVTLRQKALAALALSPEQLAFAMTPVRLEERSTANQRERIGALVGGLLPYFLLIVCLMASMYPAIDIGAGEKERGTLETLLLAPITRTEIVLGKFLVLFTFGLTSALLMVTSMGTVLRLFGSRLDADLTVILASIGAVDLAMIALMLIPTAAIFAAVLLSLSIYAKSYKEASGMMQPLAMLTLLPVLLAMVPGVNLTWLWALVPLTNVALAMKELVKGTMDYRMFSVILLSSLVIAGALLSLCRWWFSREQVLFRN